MEKVTIVKVGGAVVEDNEQLAQLSENIKKLGKPNSADVIADEVLKLAGK